MPAAPDPFIARRMRAQRLSAPMAADPAAVVAWFGAVQAQEYQPAKWALAQRAPGLTDTQIDRALADGTIIRTHGPRPTWHFIAQADARWVLTAVAPRVQLRSRTMYRTYEIDAALMTRARRIVEKALGGGQFLTRAAIGKALAAKGIEAAGIRLGLVVFVLELDQVVCSGPRQGKQFTYALFDERVRGALVLPPDEARTALAARYVASHGPVTVNDFVWWSGLTVGEARRAFESVSPALRQEAIGDHTYWSITDRSRRRAAGATCRQSICCRSTTNTSSPTAIGSRRRRCSRRARRPIPWTATRTCCASRAASAGSGDARSARGRLPCSSCPTGR